MSLVLNYWGIKARGYLPAVIAAVGGVALEWNKTPDWPGLKPNSPFGQLPYLTGPDGLVVCFLFLHSRIHSLANLFLDGTIFGYCQIHRSCCQTPR